MIGNTAQSQRRTWLWIILCLSALAGAAAIFLPRLPQDLSYHNFADHRTILGIPNLLSVASNLPFLWIGVLGLSVTRKTANVGLRGLFTEEWERLAARALFFGVSLTAFGSAWYHLAPSNETLVWDRLPMTLAFMALFSLVIADRLGMRIGRLLFWPMLADGIASVGYWRITEDA